MRCAVDVPKLRRTLTVILDVDQKESQKIVGPLKCCAELSKCSITKVRKKSIRVGKQLAPCSRLQRMEMAAYAERSCVRVCKSLFGDRLKVQDNGRHMKSVRT